MFFPLRDDIPRDSFPLATVGLIGVNVLVQLYQSTMSSERAALFIRAAGAIPWEITHLTDVIRFPDQPAALLPIPLTLLSSMFVHGGWLHLISNMWYLWLFGDNIEDALGHFRFILFYLIGGIAGALLQVLVGPNSGVPMVGASGAIACVLGGYLIQYPRARIHCLLVIFVFIQFITVPAFLVLGLWFVLQLLEGVASGTLGDVAWFAHIGGFAVGMLLIKLFIGPRRRGRSRDRRVDDIFE